MVKKKEIRKWLEEKYKREVLHGAKYIDALQRPHFRKWVKQQKFQLLISRLVTLTKSTALLSSFKSNSNLGLKKGGTWKNGTWLSGVWENGTWKDGLGENGIRRNGGER